MLCIPIFDLLVFEFTSVPSSPPPPLQPKIAMAGMASTRSVFASLTRAGGWLQYLNSSAVASQFISNSSILFFGSYAISCTQSIVAFLEYNE